ncbi:MAG: D-alanine--D-alanine ligase [Sphaerochaetaceae bacterium]
MLVGITYDLKDDYLAAGYAAEDVAECDSIQTIEAIDEALRRLGFETLRIGNIFHLVDFLAQGKRCDLVFNIAEGLHGLCREAQIPALLDAYGIPYVFSDAIVLAVALHKGMTKAVVRQQGVPTPDYRVITEEGAIDSMDMLFPVFVKPVGGGTGIGIGSYSIVRDGKALREVTTRLLRYYRQPVLVETFLDGREFTVGITGTGEKAQPVAAMEILVDPTSDQGIYSYKTKQEYKQYARYQLATGKIAEECEHVAMQAWTALGCRDGGRIDLKMDSSGKVNFLEVNPLAGLNPVDSDLPILSRMVGVDYFELISRIMASAMERISVKDA